MNHSNYNPITNTKGKQVFKFTTPLAGGFLRNEEEIKKEQLYNLSLSFYDDCGLLAVNERIPSEVLFKNYFYRTGASKKLSEHFENFSKDIRLKEFNPVLEFGCNDFTFLNAMKKEGYTILGVDPSDVSKQWCPDPKELINQRFTSNLAKTLPNKYKLIFSANSFAHIDDINDVVAGIYEALDPRGIFVFEVHWLGTLIEEKQFPFIYHEHIYYYSLRSLIQLFLKHKMNVFDVEHIDIHGGSIRVWVDKFVRGPYESVGQLLNDEKHRGLYSEETYTKFFEDITKLEVKLKNRLSRYKLEGRRIIGYGASGQSTTLLNFLKLGKEYLSFLVDDSPLKIGCYSPGVHLPIKSREEINPETDIILVLAYTFFDEIRAKIKNGSYIIPLPTYTEIHD